MQKYAARMHTTTSAVLTDRVKGRNGIRYSPRNSTLPSVLNSIPAPFTFLMYPTTKIDASWNKNASEMNDEITPICISVIPIVASSFDRYASLTRIAMKYSNVHCALYAPRESLYSRDAKRASVFSAATSAARVFVFSICTSLLPVFDHRAIIPRPAHGIKPFDYETVS